MSNRPEEAEVHDEFDLGEPIGALANFEYSHPNDLLIRTRRAIQRRTAARQLASFSLRIPSLLFKEFWLILLKP